MNSPMKRTLQIISFVGLGVSIVPAFLVFAGTLSKETCFHLLLLGMFLWFGTAVFWIKADHLNE